MNSTRQLPAPGRGPVSVNPPRRVWRYSPVAIIALLLSSCVTTMPSQRITDRVELPMPASVATPADPGRLRTDNGGEVVTISPRELLRLAFDRQPDIKSSFERFKSEEARYDFFYVSRDALTPGMRVSNELSESRERGEDRIETASREREHSVELTLEKRFFDTTEMDVGLGYRSTALEQAIGDQPFVSASVRYPLWASRKRLERASDDIFRRNELNDAQLSYIQQVRTRLSRALQRYYGVIYTAKQVDGLERWKTDLDGLLERIVTSETRNVVGDRQRVEAEIARVSAYLQDVAGTLKILRARLKAEIGLPFHARLDVVEEMFNPFEGVQHEELLQRSLDTDPELATLRNAVRNATAQLDLAKRGRWDVTLFLDGEADLEGRGEKESASDWSVSGGVAVSAVDNRVTTSLSRQARSDIARYTRAIEARENNIFVDTLDPFLSIGKLTGAHDKLAASLPRYQSDYDNGVGEYMDGTLNIDDLLTRRDTLYAQQVEVAELTYRLGLNITNLCAATGKFFELLEENGQGRHADAAGGDGNVGS